MGIVKKFNEWLNEGFLSDRPDDNYECLNDENCDVKNLYNYLIDHYEPLGDKTIEINDGKDEDDENFIEKTFVYFEDEYTEALEETVETDSIDMRKEKTIASVLDDIGVITL